MEVKLVVSLVSLLIGIACYFSVRRMRIKLQQSLQGSTVVVESSTAVRFEQDRDSAGLISVVSRSGFFTEVDKSLRWFLWVGGILILWGVVAVLDAAGVLAAFGLPFDFR